LNKINKKVVIPSILVLAFLLVSFYGVNQVLADDVVGYPPIVQKIADKFGLDVEDVGEVFEQERAEMWEKRKQIFEERLSQAVSDGKITEEQKQKILEKRDEWQAERTAERQQHREEMQKWLQDNGIDANALGPYLGFGGFGGKGFGHWHMMGK